VRKLSFVIIHSSTKALPAWRSTCTRVGLKPRLIPRDVKTRWNSMFDMLKVILEYRQAIDAIMGERTLNLRRFELIDEDWKVLADLVKVLKVCDILDLLTMLY
ncbi:hypothetical protein H0H92_016073, partial [Tricholoma furcatifolium]